MLSNLKRTTTRLSKSIKFVFLIFIFASGCALFSRPQVIPLTEREVLFEKGRALIMAQEYNKAEDLFLSLTGQSMSNPDSPYDLSLWNLSLIYEKKGMPEKSILLLTQLLNGKTKFVSKFKIQASLMKNYFRVENQTEAMTYKKILDSENPNLSFDELYNNLVETLDLNYDRSAVQELDYVREIQKYLIFVIEQNESLTNEKATELLISIYDSAYALLKKDSLNHDFKRKIAISMLTNLRRFDLLKLNDLNINLKTTVKFSKYSEQKQKQITDWLHK